MSKISSIIQLLRPKQWVKNFFVFAPLLFTGLFVKPESVFQSISAAFFFCIASSAVYVLNDLKDQERDRKHPIKSKKRPLASGALTASIAVVLLFLLYGVLVAGWFWEPSVMYAIACYLAINFFYSYGLKNQPVLDIFCIAFGFVLRVYAGAVALDVPVSAWMFVTTLCLALYLAAIKRRQELSLQGQEGRAVLQHYTLALVNRFAEIAATGALIFYAMFVMSTQQELVVSIPLVLFGFFRYWYVVECLDGGESPTDALLSDWPLLATGALWVAVCMWVLWPVMGG